MIWIVVLPMIRVQAYRMRQKTSEIIWQDAQHQHLFDLLDLIREPAAEVEVLERLLVYTTSHFALEERYMSELDFPGRSRHVAEHARFRAEVEQLALDSNNHDPLLREFIATFLSEWLMRHVLGIDKRLEAFILQSTRK